MIPDRPNMNFANLLWRVCLQEKTDSVIWTPPPAFF